MRELFKALKNLLIAGKDAVLVTLVATSGSAPRGAGARMLVSGKGRVAGTVGGGAAEFKSEQAALHVLRDKCSSTGSFALREAAVRDIGMICGGDIHLHYQYIPTGNDSMLSLLHEIEALYERGEPSYLIHDITPGQGGAMSVCGADSGLLGTGVPDEVLAVPGHKPFKTEAQGRTFFCDDLIKPGKVFIFGGGHVSQALVPILAAVDFRCTVLEDREDFCRPELFPGAAETLLIDNARVSAYISITSDDYIVVLTRGHKDDLAIQAQALKTPARYIGAIGSRRKSAAVFESLKRLGFSDNDLSRITTPIGLAIKAETPAEIAVSIAAQLILKRAAMTDA